MKTFQFQFIFYSIGESAFSNCTFLSKIDIPINSELNTIDKDSFISSNLKYLTIPSNLLYLKDGWCEATFNLTQIQISPKNPNFNYLDNKLIIGKSTLESQEYDSIFFARRDISNVTIPSFIKHIKPFAFSGCVCIQTVEIAENSELQTIEKSSFSHSSIKSIKIPPHVTQICKNAFSFSSLKNVEIPLNSELQIINKSAFLDTFIVSITIPSSLKEIGKKAFDCCTELRQVIIPTNSQLQTIEFSAFASTGIESISLPSSLTKLCESAFYSCSNLQHVEIPSDSKLKSIGIDAFAESAIESITIPLNMTNIDRFAFAQCKKTEKC